MNTSERGEVGRSAVCFQAAKRGWAVLKPDADILPYDLVLDVNGAFVKIQVKLAWKDKKTQNYMVDTRLTKTNRKKMLRSKYQEGEFDFAILFIEDLNVFYILPFEVFNSYGSSICLVESEKRQRKPKSKDFREAWNLIENWAVYFEKNKCFSVKFGEAGNIVIPSQAS